MLYQVKYEVSSENLSFQTNHPELEEILLKTFKRKTVEEALQKALDKGTLICDVLMSRIAKRGFRVNWISTSSNDVNDLVNQRLDKPSLVYEQHCRMLVSKDSTCYDDIFVQLDDGEFDYILENSLKIVQHNLFYKNKVIPVFYKVSDKVLVTESDKYVPETDKYVCECGQTLKSDKYLSRHMKSKKHVNWTINEGSGEINQETEQFTCDCGQVLTSDKYLSKHLKSKKHVSYAMNSEAASKAASEAPEAKSQPQQSGSYQCDCGQTLTSQRFLKRHQASQKHQKYLASLETEDTTLETEDTTLEAEDTTLETEDTMLETKDTTLETEDTMLETKDTTLEMEDTTLETEDTTLETEDTTLETKDTTLGMEDVTLGLSLEAKEVEREPPAIDDAVTEESLRSVKITGTDAIEVYEWLKSRNEVALFNRFAADIANMFYQATVSPLEFQTVWQLYVAESMRVEEPAMKEPVMKEPVMKEPAMKEPVMREEPKEEFYLDFAWDDYDNTSYFDAINEL